MKFFSLDSGFHKYGTIVFDMIALNIFWLITSLFGLLAPVSNAALFHSIYHVIVEEEGYMTKTYFGIIKNKFIRGLQLTLVSIPAFALAVFNLIISYRAMATGSFMQYLIGLYLLITAELVITSLFAHALLGETDMTLKQLLKYGFLLSNKHLLTSVLCLIIVIGMGAAVIFINPIVILVVGAVGFWLMSLLIHKRVFTKYYLDKLV